MNIAEGKGPKQTKKTWPLGQFVTNYGNDGTPGALNVPAVAYGQQITSSGVGYMTANGNIGYAQPGSLNPGLNLNVNGNGAVDVGFICAPDSQTTLQDIQSVTVVLIGPRSGPYDSVLDGGIDSCLELQIKTKSISQSNL
jgi:hypothetical protein